MLDKIADGVHANLFVIHTHSFQRRGSFCGTWFGSGVLQDLKWSMWNPAEFRGNLVECGEPCIEAVDGDLLLLGQVPVHIAEM
jgi:hypothetical protein